MIMLLYLQVAAVTKKYNKKKLHYIHFTLGSSVLQTEGDRTFFIRFPSYAMIITVVLQLLFLFL